MASRILVLHGPNLNLLIDLDDIDVQLEKRGKAMDVEAKSFQANSEGALVDALHAERTRISGIIVNAGRLAPGAVILAEAIGLVGRPAVEVLFELRDAKASALKPVVTEQVVGRGVDAYLQALKVMAAALSSLASRPTAALETVAAPAARSNSSFTGNNSDTDVLDKAKVKKALGRRAATEPSIVGVVKKKPLGRSTESASADASLSRALVRHKIGERLSGKLTSAGLATWARAQWQQLQHGAAVESGERDRLEDVLQTLLLSTTTKASDHQLIELMTQLG